MLEAEHDRTAIWDFLEARDLGVAPRIDRLFGTPWEFFQWCTLKGVEARLGTTTNTCLSGTCDGDRVFRHFCCSRGLLGCR